MLQPRAKGIFFSAIVNKACPLAILLFCLTSPAFSEPEKTRPNVVCRDQLLAKQRGILADKLKKITGWPSLGFSEAGALETGNTQPVGGSKSARDLITKAIGGPNLVVLEDASNRSDVVFCRVVLAKSKVGPLVKPHAYVVLIDFADFDQIMGDRRALDAFDVGWGLLHELEHVTNDSEDASTIGETGECEAHVNQMRREVGLPERAEYFFTFLPLTGTSDFKTRFVRLAFVQQVSVKNKKRFWVIWDADLVGGLDRKQEIAVLR